MDVLNIEVQEESVMDKDAEKIASLADKEKFYMTSVSYPKNDKAVDAFISILRTTKFMVEENE